MTMILLVFCCLLVANGNAISVDSHREFSSYDYSATVECMAEPGSAHYGGGMIGNAGFDKDSVEWVPVGQGNVEKRMSGTGNSFIAASNRISPSDGFGFSFRIHKDLFYTFSAWLQIDGGSEEIVVATISDEANKQHAIGTVVAKSGCWSMLKGGFTFENDTKALLFFSTKNTSVEIWMDNVSLKSFDAKQWREQQDRSIDRVRKRRLRVHCTKDGRNIEGAAVKIDQTRSHFPIGGGVTAAILNNKSYEEWFTSRFNAATFTNEMKWYYTQASPGKENFTVADAMIDLMKKYNISVRGHTVLWNKDTVTPYWVKLLPKTEIFAAAVAHMANVMLRYSGDVIAWDVLNEDLHYLFYDGILGPNASSIIFQIAHALDPTTPLFLNEFNTMEFPLDRFAMPHKYVGKVREIRSFPGNERIRLKIGLEGHFWDKPILPYIRPALDILAAVNVSVWFTELDTRPGPDQARDLEAVMREAFSHPAVEGVMVWGAWRPGACNDTCLSEVVKNSTLAFTGCGKMCLVDEGIRNLPPGDTVDGLLREWRTVNATGMTDGDGIYEQSVFMGGYNITCSHPLVAGDGFVAAYVAGDANNATEVWVSM